MARRNIETAKETLDKVDKAERIIRFRKGDELTLVVITDLDGEEDLVSRRTGFRPRGADGQPGEEVLKYKFLLKREGRQLPVYITLGVFTSLPLVKRGFGPSDSEAQRIGANNAIFDGFYMRSAEEIIANLRKGVICDEVFTTSQYSYQCYRWRLK